MKHKALISSALALSLAFAPVSNANAYDHYRSHYHHGGHGVGPVLGILGIGAALVGAAALIATAPVRAIADSGPEPVSYDYPGYNPGPQSYYQPQPQAYYAPAPRYYAPAPAYAYYPQPVYYQRGYYRY